MCCCCLFHQRLHIAQELADKASEGRAYCSIGNCLRAILQPDKAMECYKRVSPGVIYNSELELVYSSPYALPSYFIHFLIHIFFLFLPRVSVLHQTLMIKLVLVYVIVTLLQHTKF